MSQTQTEEESGAAEEGEGLEDTEKFFCQPCKNGLKTTDAFGYCRDCEEFLCEECYTYHTRLSICRHHILMDKAAMPSDVSRDTPKDWCVKRCDNHEQELVKYFCNGHAQLGCSICMVITHRQCEGVEYIPTVSQDFIEGEEFKYFNAKIVRMKKLSEHIMASARENVASAARHYSKAMENVNKLRQEIIHALDQLENDVKEQTEKLSKEDHKRLSAMCNKCENVLNDLNAIDNECKDLKSKKQHSQLFICIKSYANKISDLDKVLKEIGSKSAVKYNFHRSKEVQHILKTPDKLGKLFKWDLTDAGANHVTDINVKTDTDRNTCCITGSLMVSESELVIADRINDKLKIVNLEQKKVISEISLPSSPWDVAELRKGSFAVTLPKENKILVVSSDCGSLSITREINVGSQCWGVAFGNGKLVVTHEDPGSVDIMDLDGNVVQTFSKDEEGKELFKRPSYAAVTDDLQTIYVADWDSNSVTSLDNEGKVKQVYKDQDLEYPGKLVVDQTGVVTVCGINSSNVHLISSDCTKIQIFSNTAELDHPRTVSYSMDNEKLYVGMWENDNIRVYQLT